MKGLVLTGSGVGTSTSPPPARRVVAGWLVAWLGMVLAALLNGTFRALVTQPLIGETAARFVATLLLLALVTAYEWWLLARLPIPTAGVAWLIGASWVVMTLAFELGFGRFVEQLSWQTMLADYDLTRGRIWVLVPLWLLVAPAVLRRLRHPRP
jgi:hypothetical protein